MQLARLKRISFLGVGLVVVGLTGHALAQPSTPPTPEAAPAITLHSPVWRTPQFAPPAHAPARPTAPTWHTPPPQPSPTHSPATQGPSIVHAAGDARTPETTATTTVKRSATGPAGSHLGTGTPAVALTFDDGPDPVQTPKLLQLLAAQHVHATFCLIGRNVQAHPAVVRQIVAGGHTLCNHTWRHSLTIGRQSTAEIRADLQRTNDAIHKAAPGAAIKYFRAPGGNFTTRLVSVARQLGMTSIYWKVDPRDWDHSHGESHAAHRDRVIRAVETHVRKGSIVLSHDFGQPDTIAAYRTLLPWLRARYQLIALP